MTSASLLGYGTTPQRALLPYGMSPIAQFLPLEIFGAVTIRTVTREPREGHFTLRTDWKLREWPQMLREYRGVLQRVDSGWLNAFGWCNIGVEAYFAEDFPRTTHLNRIVSLGGFSADEFCELVEYVNGHAAPGEIAGVEFNISCHNVNFPFEAIIEEVLVRAVGKSRHPVLLKISPDTDYVRIARMAQQCGVAAITAMNTVKGLRLNPRTGRPLLTNGFGGLSGRSVKPIGLRVVNELRQAVDLPILASGGIRTYDDCLEYFWAGADAVSLGSESWLAPWWGYLLAPLKAWRIRRLVRRVQRYPVPSAVRRYAAAQTTAF